MSGILRIKESYSMLSKNEKKIADYILENDLDAYDLAIKDLAERSQMSPSCIMRFTKKIGYESYTQLRIDLAKESEKDMYTSDQLIGNITKDDSVSDLMQTLHQFTINTINKTFDYLDKKKLEKAIEILANARKICFVGGGTSLLIGMDLCHKFLLAGIDSCCHDDAHTQLTQVNDMTPEDAIIIITYSGTSQLGDIAVKRANQLKVPTITISKNVNSYLTKKSTVPLFVPSLEEERRIGSVASRVSCTILTDILYLGTIQGNIDEITANVAQVRKLLKELKIAK